jgi:hypothetical protein
VLPDSSPRLSVITVKNNNTIVDNIDEAFWKAIYINDITLKDKDDIELNTIYNRMLHLTIKKFNNKLSINPFYTDMKSEKYFNIDLNDASTIENITNKYMGLYRMFNLKMIKYHFVNNFIMENKDILKDFITLTTILNTFTYNYNHNYNIIQSNAHEYDLLNNELLKYTDNDDLSSNKLTYILINNSFFPKKTTNNYYYYFKFDGPFPFCSTLNYYTYLRQLNIFQPLKNITSILKNIENAYKGSPPFYSKNLNLELIHYIQNNDILSDDIHKRLVDIFSFTNYKRDDFYKNDTIYIYHGTNNLIHKQSDKEINLTTFLSCSFNIYIALNYSTNNNIKNCGIVYVLKINDKIDYINFNDTLFQIILLPGLKILIEKEVNIGNIKYIFCNVSHSSKGSQYSIDLFNSITLNKPVYSNISYKIKENIFLSITDNIIFNQPLCIKNINSFEYIIFNNTNDICIDKEKIYTSLGKISNNYYPCKFNDIKYTLHQFIICECYKILEVKCLDYFLYCSNEKIYTAWKYNKNYKTVKNVDFKYDINSYFIDCLMSNIDCLNYKNYLENNNKFILRTFEGCGLYDLNCLKKLNFNLTDEPLEHYILIKYLSRLDHIYIKSFSYKKSEILKRRARHSIPNILKIESHLKHHL